jgi:hypothetical protein
VGLDHEHTRYYSARPRRVPLEFCTDELLEECSLLAALTLYRIISQADDQGRLAGSPKYVRALCFGMRPNVSEAAVAKALRELVAARFLIRYESRGRLLLQVDRWLISKASGVATPTPAGTPHHPAGPATGSAQRASPMRANCTQMTSSLRANCTPPSLSLPLSLPLPRPLPRSLPLSLPRVVLARRCEMAVGVRQETCFAM